MERLISLLSASDNDKGKFRNGISDYPLIAINSGTCELWYASDINEIPISIGDKAIVFLHKENDKEINTDRVRSVYDVYKCDTVVGIHTHDEVEDHLHYQEVKTFCKAVSKYNMVLNPSIVNLLNTIIDNANNVLEDSQQRNCNYEFDQLWQLLNPLIPWRYEFFLEITLRLIPLGAEDIEVIKTIFFTEDEENLTMYERICTLSEEEKIEFNLIKQGIARLMESRGEQSSPISEEYINIYDDIYERLYKLAEKEKEALERESETNKWN